MDKNFKKMFKYFTAFTLEGTRRFSMLPRVGSVGFLPEKRERVERTFSSCNFSFIFQGEGEYIFRGKRFEVKAPCMLVQWPGEPMSYGADTFWSEMFFIYPGETFPVWEHAGLLSLDNPVRKMHNSNRVLEQALELQRHLRHPEWNGDRVDLFCYSLVLETWTEEQKVLLENTHIPEIRQWIENSIGGDMDCNALADKFNMSLSSLRRYWNRYHGDETFMEYRNNCFLQKSCCLLAETDLEIKEIADRMNFADAFYFSRKFHQLTGLTPGEYRKKHKTIQHGLSRH